MCTRLALVHTQAIVHIAHFNERVCIHTSSVIGSESKFNRFYIFTSRSMDSVCRLVEIWVLLMQGLQRKNNIFVLSLFSLVRFGVIPCSLTLLAGEEIVSNVTWKQIQCDGTIILWSMDDFSKASVKSWFSFSIFSRCNSDTIRKWHNLTWVCVLVQSAAVHDGARRSLLANDRERVRAMFVCHRFLPSQSRSRYSIELWYVKRVQLKRVQWIEIKTILKIKG